MSNPDATKDRLIEAAGREFAEKGFEAARIRTICDRAGANLAAVNYHFGDKEQLYRVVLLEAYRRRSTTVTPELGDLPAAEKLRGAVLVRDDRDMLLGIFTDSDLVRLFEKRREAELDRPIGEVMTASPFRATAGAMLGEAVELMKSRKISELPVVDPEGRLLGLIDVTDLIGASPEDFEE